MDSTHFEDRTVIDNQGNRVGRISGVYLDDDTQVPQWGLIQTGLFGGKHTFVPLVGATMEGDEVRVPYDEAHIKDAPRIEADGELSVEEEAELTRHYGMGLSTEASNSGLVTGSPQPHVAGGEGGASMTLSEERMRVGTLRRPSELVRLRKTVVTEPVAQTVPLQHEEVRVEREPILDAEGAAEATIGEEEHEVTLSREEPVVEKTTVPVERVSLQKDVTAEEVEVTGEVRKESLEVDREPQR